MAKDKRIFSYLFLGFLIVSFVGCATCKVPYKKELTGDPRLEEANISYKKALRWIKKGQCAATAAKTQESYLTASSYLSDAVFKLKQLGHDKDIDVSDDIYYCENIKLEIHVKEGAARKEMMP